jgi:hypothetical protein
LCCFILFDFVKIYNYINARIFRQLFSAIKQAKRPLQAVSLRVALNPPKGEAGTISQIR